jgi:mRNA interferase MazF
MPANNAQRGDIFWAEFPEDESVGSEQRGRRPALIVSADIINRSLPIVIVVPLTSNVAKKNRQFRIAIPESQKIQEPGTSGCPGESIALTEQVRMMSTTRLDNRRVARVTGSAIGAVEAGLSFVLSIP